VNSVSHQHIDINEVHDMHYIENIPVTLVKLTIVSKRSGLLVRHRQSIRRVGWQTL